METPWEVAPFESPAALRNALLLIPTYLGQAIKQSFPGSDWHRFWGRRQNLSEKPAKFLRGDAPVFDLTFPNNEGPPAHQGERLDVVIVSDTITPNFLLPILCICLRRFGTCRAFVAVPKAAVHEHRKFASDESKIGRAG